MILFIAPVYRRLIRHQAQLLHEPKVIYRTWRIKQLSTHFEFALAMARTLFRPNFEGFKSVVLGSTTSEVGNFLNQLSSLLIIWVGVYQG